MKVGIFVFTGLVLIALLMLNFSKGLSLFASTYRINVIMPTVSGLKPKAGVMISGVPIGNVVSTQLSSSGTNVNIVLKILSKFKVRSDASFHIDALGFLGDQYMAITPGNNPQAPLLKDGDIVIGLAPFNLQEAVRSTSGLLDQARQTMLNLNQAITNINRTILSQQTLTNLSDVISNLQGITASAKNVTETVDAVVRSNSVPLAITLTNLQNLSQKFSAIADGLEGTFSTNQADLTETMRNLRATAQNMNQISAGLQDGKGVAGSLLKDEVLRAQTAEMVANMNALASNLSLFSSNLNKKGLWSMLWKPKQAKEAPHRSKD
jgi:phospholipid/cholesterol/gamma-HCH transport system substrate-binding protein